MERSKNRLNRHDLVFFSRAAIATVMATARPIQPDAPPDYLDALAALAGSVIPGIVRRQESTDENCVDVGFSCPQRVGTVHYRVSASVPLAAVTSIATPFEVMRLACAPEKTPFHAVISALYESAGRCGLAAGLLGSRALQAITGLGYLADASDFDLILQGSPDALPAFAAEAAAIEKTHGIDADIEVRLPYGGGWLDVKLKEWLSGSRQVMGKSISGAILVERTECLG